MIIPYRESVLTQILKNSLGGNSITFIIGNVSPCEKDVSESINTLKFLERARLIKNIPVVNLLKESDDIKK
jgi:kinesin family protein 15